MSADFDPKEMIDYAEQIAQNMASDMPDDEAILMTRDFVRVMHDWQPEVYSKIADDPTMLAITSLTTAKLFELAFLKAYSYSERHVQAREAIEKVLGEQS